jgi:hypothetical protein
MVPTCEIVLSTALPVAASMRTTLTFLFLPTPVLPRPRRSPSQEEPRSAPEALLEIEASTACPSEGIASPLPPPHLFSNYLCL